MSAKIIVLCHFQRLDEQLIVPILEKDLVDFPNNILKIKGNSDLDKLQKTVLLELLRLLKCKNLNVKSLNLPFRLFHLWLKFDGNKFFSRYTWEKMIIIENKTIDLRLSHL